MNEKSNTNTVAGTNVPKMQSNSAVVRQWVVALGALLCAIYLYMDILGWVSSHWTRPDYSHGPIVVGFSAFLLWTRRERLQHTASSDRQVDGLLAGVAMVMFGLALRLFGIYTAVLTFEALSLLPFLGGLLLITFGRKAMGWAAAPVAFLIFMIPLPGFLSGSMSAGLQATATTICVFALQCCGVPASADGNVIYLSDSTIGVAEACSGLRMLYSFVAVTVAGCLIGNRSILEKTLLLLSAVPIAILANCIRITLTGLAYEWFSEGLTPHLLHDFWGLAMLPLAVGLVYAEIKLLKIVLVPEDQPKAKDPIDEQ